MEKTDSGAGSGNGANSSVLCGWNDPCDHGCKEGEGGGHYSVGLKMMNSLTRAKNEFVTMSGDRQVKWYMCGPTVYAPSHMGHARTYLGFDIIRRILEGYFNYEVTLIMNITDLDDKIIQRSNEQNISSEQLAKHFEAEFHQDMKMLGVSPPSVLTRVTEYMDDIVEYIRVIVEDKKLAYESNGSVYFDTEAFRGAGFDYCKLAPEQMNNTELLAEGEGKLTQDFSSDKHSTRDFALWKKSKPGEPSWDSPWGQGRPGWHIECSVMASRVLTSMKPGGGGSGVDCMDIHSGGVDLKFPHHDNEMAQAEAHAGCHQWVNYFVHSGHLHIKGFKMSKSLKNFITIRQALEQNTARQVRLCFLRHKYNAPMDYGDNTMEHAIHMERTFAEFFHNVKAALRAISSNSNAAYKTDTDEPLTAQHQKWGAEEHALDNDLKDCQSAVDEALKDDFDTPRVLSTLADLVKSTNTYLQSKDTAKATPNALVLRNVAVYVTRIFKVFGLTGSSTADEIGFGADVGASAEGGADKEEVLTPVLEALMAFRSQVRELARSGDTAGVLKQCDAFRDDTLPPLGIRLEDKTGGASVWKLDDPQVLMKERDLKRQEIARKEEEKRQRAAAEALKEAQNKIPPEEYMANLTTVEEGEEKKKYGKFDETGMPTHMAATGEELTKGQKKTAAKEFNAQKKKYDKWAQKQQEN